MFWTSQNIWTLTLQRNIRKGTLCMYFNSKICYDKQVWQLHVCTKNQLVFEIWILKAYTGAYVFLKLFIQSFKFKKRVTACATKSILEVMLKKLLQLKYISFNYVFQSVRQCHLDQSFQIAGTNCHNTLYIINFQKIGLAQVNFSWKWHFSWLNR